MPHYFRALFTFWHNKVFHSYYLLLSLPLDLETAVCPGILIPILKYLQTALRGQKVLHITGQASGESVHGTGSQELYSKKLIFGYWLYPVPKVLPRWGSWSTVTSVYMYSFSLSCNVHVIIILKLAHQTTASSKPSNEDSLRFLCSVVHVIPQWRYISEYCAHKLF